MLSSLAHSIRKNINLLAIAFFSLCVHLIPFVYSRNPLGYDTGFYRRYLIQPFLPFPNSPVPGLGNDALVPRIIFDTLRSSGLPTDIILYGSLIVIFACIPVVFYFLISESSNRRAALMGTLMIALSPVQYYAYWFMLWKNAWAILVLVVIFLLIKRGRFVPVLFLDVVL
jgi:hypothetical protein